MDLYARCQILVGFGVRTPVTGSRLALDQDGDEPVSVLCRAQILGICGLERMPGFAFIDRLSVRLP
jgi:hypothetical protein